MGCISSALGVPEVKIDAAAVTEQATDASKAIVDAIPDKERDLRNEAHKAGDKGYAVPNTKMVLIEGKSTDVDFKKAAAALAAAGEAVDRVKDALWEQTRPNLESQLPDGVPEMAKNKAMDLAKGQFDKLVDKAIDKAIEKAQGGGGEGGDKKAEPKKEEPKKEEPKKKKDEESSGDEDGGDD